MKPLSKTPGQPHASHHLVSCAISLVRCGVLKSFVLLFSQDSSTNVSPFHHVRRFRYLVLRFTFEFGEAFVIITHWREPNRYIIDGVSDIDFSAFT